MRKLWCSLLSTFNNQPTRLRAFFHWVSWDWNKIRRGARQRNKGDVIRCQLLIHVVLHRAQESTRYQVTRSYSFWSVKTVGVMSEPILKPGEVNQGNHGSVFNIQFANGAKISLFFYHQSAVRKRECADFLLSVLFSRLPNWESSWCKKLSSLRRFLSIS